MVPISICVGCGLAVDPITGFLSVERRPNGGIGCTNTGAADDGLFLTAVTGDTATVDMFGTGTLADPIKGNVIRSPDACNKIELRGNGVYVGCTQKKTGADSHASPNNNVLPLAISGPNNTYGFEGVPVAITNDLCCSVEGRVTIDVGGLFVTLNTGFIAQAHLEVKIDGGGFVSSSPDTTKIVNNNGTGNLRGDFNNITDNIWLAPMASGGTVTYTPRLIVTVIGAAAAAGTLDGAIFFETQWTFV